MGFKSTFNTQQAQDYTAVAPLHEDPLSHHVVEVLEADLSVHVSIHSTDDLFQGFLVDIFSQILGNLPQIIYSEVSSSVLVVLLENNPDILSCVLVCRIRCDPQEVSEAKLSDVLLIVLRHDVIDGLLLGWVSEFEKSGSEFQGSNEAVTVEIKAVEHFLQVQDILLGQTWVLVLSWVEVLASRGPVDLLLLVSVVTLVSGLA